MNARPLLHATLLVLVPVLLLASVAQAGFRIKPPGNKYAARQPITEGIIREFDARDEVQIFIQGTTGDYIEIEFARGMICVGPDGRGVNHDRLEDAVDDGLLYKIEAHAHRGPKGWIVWKAIVSPVNG